MLEVSSALPSPSKAADQHGHGGFLLPTSYCGGGGSGEDCFMVDDDDINLLDYIDFTACCDDVVVPSFFDADDGDDDVLPDLEVDPTETEELLAEFEDRHTTTSPAPCCRDHHNHGGAATAAETKPPPPPSDQKSNNGDGGGDEVSSAVATTEDSAAADSKSSSSSAEGQSNKKKTKPPSKNSSSHGGNNKKKSKVEWTPELHRKFVQAVEQLGIDKAMPSRILEIMGIECLTRHNIASHLQKYRSHRKHVMAREAEAASWAQKRQMYAASVSVVGGQTKTKDMPAPVAAAGPWVVPPAIGFPPPPLFGVRPLHVWGHPPSTGGVEAPPMLPVWPRHLAPPPRPWAASYWQQYTNNVQAASRKWGPPTQGTPCVPPPPAPAAAAAAAMLPRFPAPPPVVVPGMMPHPIVPMYRPIQPPSKLLLQVDAHPSKESIDAAIGDVLVKPWLPLPLGLKPPSLDSVMAELHKQGIPSIPPAAAHPPSSPAAHARPSHPSTPHLVN